MTEIRITLQDRHHPRSKFCRDVKPLFFDAFNLDWKRFCREGMTPEELRGPGQHLDLIDRLEITARERLGLPVDGGGAA